MDDALDQLIQAFGVDGEGLVRRLRGNGPHGYQVQLIHTDLLPENNLKGGLYSMGIERDQWDKPISYNILKKFPQEGGIGNDYQPIPANQIIHFFEPHVIGACRGMPRGIASMNTIYQLGKYRDAELIAAQMGACKSIFFTQNGAVSADPYNPSGTPTPEGNSTPQQILRPGIQENHLSPGMAEALPMGIDVKTLDATHPNAAFEPFNRELKREIAAGFGMSYNILYSDYQNTSFSALKAAYNQDKQFIEDLQQLFIKKVLDVIFEDWLECACISGVLTLPPVAGSYDVYKAHEFIPPAFPFADPIKDIAAQEAQFDLGLTSLSELCAKQGGNFEDVLISRKKDRELMAQYGETVIAPMPLANPAMGKPGTAPNTDVVQPVAPEASPMQKPNK